MKTKPLKQVVAVLVLAVLSVPVTAAGFDAKLDWADVRVVSIPVEGLVVSVDAQPGQRVTKGASLIRFSRSAPGFNLRKAQAAYDATRPALKEALREKNDAEVLYEQTVLSDVELQSALIKYEQIKANHETAKAELDKAKWALGWTRIKSPYDGLVIASSVRPGQMVAGDVRSKPLMTLASTNVMRAVATVGVERLGSINTGDSMSVEVENRSYPAKVVRLEYLTAKNAVDRITMVLEFSTPDSLYRGMKASITPP